MKEKKIKEFIRDRYSKIAMERQNYIDTIKDAGFKDVEVVE